DLHRQQRVGRRVIGIAEAEVTGGKRIGRVLQRGDRLVGAGRGIVDAGDVEGAGIEGRHWLHSAICLCVVVFDLERETGVGGGNTYHMPLFLSLTYFVSRPVPPPPLPSCPPRRSSDLTFTANSALAGESLGSLKPKSLAVNV